MKTIGLANWILRVRLILIYFGYLRSKYRRIILYPVYKLFKVLCSISNCYIPLTAELGARLILPHGLYGVFISKNAIIGDDVTIMHQVTIGSDPFDTSDQGSPIIGNGCKIGAGAKIIGSVQIPQNSIIGANKVVHKYNF